VISGEKTNRFSELAAALVGATRRLDRSFHAVAPSKNHIVEGIADVRGLALQDVPDPCGECGITLTFYAPTA
jgi:hypothetical protein